jgi:hypothetical protein
MKHMLMLGVGILLFGTMFAQKGKVTAKETEDFGVVSKDDLMAKESAIDKTAAAEVIFNVATQEIGIYSSGVEITYKIHRRVKIYNDKGLDEADVKVNYIARNGLESINKLEAQTYNIDAAGNVVITKLDKKSIFNKKVDNRSNQQIFTFPDVKAGSVIEYKYVFKSLVPYIEKWYFQEEIPVRYSRFALDYPEEFTITPMFQALQDYKYDKKQSSGRITQHVSMSNVPGLNTEPFISCYEDYWQKVSFKITGYYSPAAGVSRNYNVQWPRIVKELMEDEDFGVQLKRNIPRTKELDEQLKLLSKPEEKMIAVHKFVKKNMVWDGDYSLWALDGVKSAWNSKKGNSGEINLILINLLKDAGLKAYPILVSTRKHGRVNTTDPRLGQFNTVMAYVQIGDNTYYLDGTDQNTPSHLIPDRVMYSEGLVISQVDFDRSIGDQEWGWVVIWDDKSKYTQRSHITASITPEGLLTGEAFIDCSGYSKTEELLCWKEGKEKFLEDHFTKAYHGITVSDFNASNQDKDSLPFSQKVKFSIPTNSSGDYKYFSINLFCGLEKNPFIADTRVSDIFYGHNQGYTMSGAIRIPDGYELEALPNNIRMIMPDTSIVVSRLAQQEGAFMQYRITLEYKRPFYTTDEYPLVWDFHKKLYAMLNEQIVIKKKA